MPILFQDGFETGDASRWGVNGTPSVVSTYSYGGKYSLRCSVPAKWSSSGVTKDVGARNFFNTRLYVLYETLPQQDWDSVDLIRVGTDLLLGDPDKHMVLRLQHMTGSDCRWNVADYANSVEYVSSSFTPSLYTWYCLELRAVRGTTDGELYLYFNGSNVISQTGINTNRNDAQYGMLQFGCCSDGGEAETKYIDSIIIADTYIGLVDHMGCTLRPIKPANRGAIF